jgi:hypothetical protein
VPAPTTIESIKDQVVCRGSINAEDVHYFFDPSFVLSNLPFAVGVKLPLNTVASAAFCVVARMLVYRARKAGAHHLSPPDRGHGQALSSALATNTEAEKLRFSASFRRYRMTTSFTLSAEAAQGKHHCVLP